MTEITRAANPGRHAARNDHRLSADAHAGVRRWLVAIVFLLVAMIIVGGATRLTDSGLSITEWRPILGAIPPLSEAHWREAFEKYKLIPEYKLINKGMSLEAFKVIYWWEWGHRFLGRLIGLAFALPLAFFWLRGAVSGGLARRLLFILALGGLQGAVGWYMVRSGLVDRVDVSHYRLALHLGLALIILALVVAVIVDLAPKRDPLPAATSLDRRLAIGLVVLIAVQVTFGAFVAGLKAGLVYNTWPLMDGRLVPEGLGLLSPWWRNFVETTLGTQFMHRKLAYAVLAVALVHAGLLMARPEQGRLATTALALALGLLAQAAIGIWTLLANVPLWLGLLHQGGAALIVILATWHLKRVLAGAANLVDHRA